MVFLLRRHGYFWSIKSATFIEKIVFSGRKPGDPLLLMAKKSSFIKYGEIVSTFVDVFFFYKRLEGFSFFIEYKRRFFHKRPKDLLI